MPVPPAGATQTADHIDAVEDTPLLHDSRDPAETDTDRMVQPSKPSAVEVIAGKSFTGPTGWAAQVGLVVATVVLWRVLWVHPAGESSSRGRFEIFRLGVGADEESDNRGVGEVRSFYVSSSTAIPRRARLPRRCVRAPNFHQSASPSLTVGTFLSSGILLLQPQPASAQQKRKGLQIHQVFQYASLVAIVGGAAVIIYNKAIHGGAARVTDFFPWPTTTR